MSPRWLVASTVAVIATIATLSVGWWGACTFWIGPQIWRTYVQTDGRLPQQEPDACKDADARALQVLTGLLATLLALHSDPPGRE